jgi:Prohead core protein serine protease
MKIISEHFDTKVITEAKEGKKFTYLIGPAAVAETANRNKRIYPARILEREINRYAREHIAERTAFGELTHPTGAQVNPERVSHLFTEVNRRGNQWIAKARLLETPMGKIAIAITEGGGKLGFSTRGVGSLRSLPKGTNEVGEDYHLCTLADLVSDPSAPGAWTNSLCENYEFYYNSSTNEIEAYAYEEARHRMRNRPVSNLTEEEKAEMFAEFCRLIK